MKNRAAESATEAFKLASEELHAKRSRLTVFVISQLQRFDNELTLALLPCYENIQPIGIGINEIGLSNPCRPQFRSTYGLFEKTDAKQLWIEDSAITGHQSTHLIRMNSHVFVEGMISALATAAAMNALRFQQQQERVAGFWTGADQPYIPKSFWACSLGCATTHCAHHSEF